MVPVGGAIASWSRVFGKAGEGVCSELCNTRKGAGDEGEHSVLLYFDGIGIASRSRSDITYAGGMVEWWAGRLGSLPRAEYVH